MARQEFTKPIELLSSLALNTLRCLPPDAPPQAGQPMSISLAAGPAFMLAQGAMDRCQSLPSSDGKHAGRSSERDSGGNSGGEGLGVLVRADMRLADPAGHVRPVYFYLASHLFLTALDQLPAAMRRTAQPQVRLLAERLEGLAETSADLSLWLALVMFEAGHALADDALRHRAIALARPWLDASSSDGSLHEMTPDDSLDAWTWRELVGLAAADHLARLTGDAAWVERCRNVAIHHLENTQPDNTTTQPWAAAAFLSNPSTASFGIQQIHDATTQGSGTGGHSEGHSGGKVGLVSAMLMADAAWALAQACD